MEYKERLSRPEKGNKFYITKKKGGYSPCIVGSPADPDCDVLANCVGYALGRFHEIAAEKSFKYLSNTNAENMFDCAKGLKTGQVPKVGAMLCWRKGKTWDSSDGCGHVAIVEKVISENEIVTSESAWDGDAFYTKTRKRGTNGNWGMSTAYSFRGFIYNPAVPDVPALAQNQKSSVTKTEKCVLAYVAAVRAEPSDTSARIGTILPGRYVYVYKGSETKRKSYTYVKIKWLGKEAWIVKSALK